jgi:hypothetical protein
VDWEGKEEVKYHPNAEIGRMEKEFLARKYNDEEEGAEEEEEDDGGDNPLNL